LGWNILPVRDEVFPASERRPIKLLVERVDVRMNGLEVRSSPNGVAGPSAGTTSEAHGMS
jgi:hypothetical protein